MHTMRLTPQLARVKSERVAGPTRDQTGRRVMSSRIRFAPLLALMSAIILSPKPTDAAIAGQPDPADVATIDSCVADARAAKTDPGICIGRVSGSCLETAAATSAME